MILLTARRASVSGEAPWYSAGYSIAPTPMIAPWPVISRGTEWTVPMRARVGQADRRAGEVVDGQLAGAGLAHDVLVRRPELGEVHRLGVLDGRHEQLRVPSRLGEVDGQAEVDVRGLDHGRLAVDLGEDVVHLRASAPAP